MSKVPVSLATDKYILALVLLSIVIVANYITMLPYIKCVNKIDGNYFPLDYNVANMNYHWQC